MNILLLGDITGRSRVAVRMQTAALERLGHEVYALPTALISNTLNLGQHAQLDTTNYLLDALSVWQRLGFHFDAVIVGYVASHSQAQAIAKAIVPLRKSDALLLVDPILGDNGRRYNSISDSQAKGLSLLCGMADCITPNLTEAALLAGCSYEDALRDVPALARCLGEKTGASVVLTSASLLSRPHVVCGTDRTSGHFWAFDYAEIGQKRGGTGDLFSALLLHALLSGISAENAARQAHEGVTAELRKAEGSLLPAL